MEGSFEDHLLHIHLFGPFQARCGGAPLAGLERPRLQGLLAYLILHRQEPVSRQLLAFSLWPDTFEHQAQTNLRSLLHRLGELWPESGSYIDVARRSLQWAPRQPWSCDLVEFEHQLAIAGRAAEPDQQRQHLQTAVAACRGPLMKGHSDEWLDSPRAQLHQRFLLALQQLAETQEADGDLSGAIRSLERYLAEEPYHDPTCRRLMRLYEHNGDRAGALHQFHRFTRLLRKEMGVDPDPATLALYRTIQRHAPGHSLRLTAAGTGEPVLVGRRAAWSELMDSWQQVVAEGQGAHCVLVTGEPGIGKSRLVEEFVAWARRQGATVALARCYSREGGLPYHPVVAWLRAFSLEGLGSGWRRELSVLLPELDAPVAPFAYGGAMGQRQRLFDALNAAALAQAQPTALVLDDCMWADKESLEWLHYLVRTARQSRLMVVLTCRSEATGPDQAAIPLIAALRQRDGFREIELERLTAEETARLAHFLLGLSLSPSAAEALHVYSEGNPLLLVEAIRALEDDAALPADRIAELFQRTPPRLQAVVAERLAQLSAAARTVLAVAAVVGRSFQVAVLHETRLFQREALLAGIDELWQQQFIRELDGQSYEFGHELVRRVVYQSISAVRRQYLHGKVAGALLAVAGSNPDPVSAELARHYELAGEQMEAANFYRRAAAAARTRYAESDSVAFSERALDLLEALAATTAGGHELAALRSQQAEILLDRDWMWRLVGRMDAFRADVVRLRRLADQLDDPLLRVQCARREAFVLFRHCRLDEALAAAHEALAGARLAGSRRDEAVSCQLLGRIHRARGDVHRAIACQETARQLFSQIGDTIQAVHCLSYLATAWLWRGDAGRSFEIAAEALALCEAAGLALHRRFPLGDLGAAAVELGQEQCGEAHLAESLALARQVSDRTQQVFCLGHLGWLAVGRQEGTPPGALARQRLEEACEIAQQSDLFIYRPWLLAGLALAHAQLAARPEAQRLAAQALSLAREYGLPQEEALVLSVLDRLTSPA